MLSYLWPSRARGAPNTQHAAEVAALSSPRAHTPLGELGAALRHGAKQPQVLPLLVGSSICGYASVSVVLLLIKLYGATVTELVKSMRKAPRRESVSVAE